MRAGSAGRRTTRRVAAAGNADRTDPGSQARSGRAPTGESQEQGEGSGESAADKEGAIQLYRSRVADAEGGGWIPTGLQHADRGRARLSADRRTEGDASGQRQTTDGAVGGGYRRTVRTETGKSSGRQRVLLG